MAEQGVKIWSVQVSDNQGGIKRLFANLGPLGLNLKCFEINYDERGLFWAGLPPQLPEKWFSLYLPVAAPPWHGQA